MFTNKWSNKVIIIVVSNKLEHYKLWKCCVVLFRVHVIVLVLRCVVLCCVVLCWVFIAFVGLVTGHTLIIKTTLVSFCLSLICILKMAYLYNWCLFLFVFVCLDCSRSRLFPSDMTGLDFTLLYLIIIAFVFYFFYCICCSMSVIRADHHPERSRNKFKKPNAFLCVNILIM